MLFTDKFGEVGLSCEMFIICAEAAFLELEKCPVKNS